MQTKWGSLVESWANIAIGFTINYSANVLILPWLWNNDNKFSSAFQIGLVFTVISQIRSYVLRRWFNGLKFGNKAEVVIEKRTDRGINSEFDHAITG